MNETVVSSIEKKKFTTKDLVALGILNAVIIVVTLVIGVLLSILPPILQVFMDVVVSLFVGVIYLLMATKIPKFGIFTLNSILFSALLLLIWAILEPLPVSA